MNIKLVQMYGIFPAHHGIGLSYGLTSGMECWKDCTCASESEPEHLETKDRLYKVAEKLCKKSGGEDKFLRMIVYWWDITAPRYWWQEMDTYKVGTVAQSESSIHTILHKELTQKNFEDFVPPSVLESLNNVIKEYRETKNPKALTTIKNMLPEGFLQRRIWMANLAVMKNIYHQRKNHRLVQWRVVCDAFVMNTPVHLLGVYGLDK